MEKPFVFDLDENDLPKLTADNVERNNFIIENDSNYRIFEDRDNENSISNLIKNNPNADKWSEDFILKLVIEIDNQNSTQISRMCESVGYRNVYRTGFHRKIHLRYEHSDQKSAENEVFRPTFG